MTWFIWSVKPINPEKPDAPKIPVVRDSRPSLAFGPRDSTPDILRLDWRQSGWQDSMSFEGRKAVGAWQRLLTSNQIMQEPWKKKNKRRMDYQRTRSIGKSHLISRFSLYRCTAWTLSAPWNAHPKQPLYQSPWTNHVFPFQDCDKTSAFPYWGRLLKKHDLSPSHHRLHVMVAGNSYPPHQARKTLQSQMYSNNYYLNGWMPRSTCRIVCSVHQAQFSWLMFWTGNPSLGLSLMVSHPLTWRKVPARKFILCCGCFGFSPLIDLCSTTSLPYWNSRCFNDQLLHAAFTMYLFSQGHYTVNRTWRPSQW